MKLVDLGLCAFFIVPRRLQFRLVTFCDFSGSFCLLVGLGVCFELGSPVA